MRDITDNEMKAVLAYDSLLTFIVKVDCFLDKERLVWLRSRISDAQSRDESDAHNRFLAAAMEFVDDIMASNEAASKLD